MQCVILAAGASSRFVPFNESFSHKSLITILGKTIIEHTLCALKKANITDVILVVNKKNDFEKIFGNGLNLGIKISYVILPEPLGMGEALLKAEDLLQDNFFVTNPNHLEIDKFVEKMISIQAKQDIVLLGKKDNGFNDFGFMEIENNNVISILEKPGKEIFNALRIIGIYLLNKSFIKTLKNVEKGHYNFESALNKYAIEKKVKYLRTDEEVFSLKYAWDLFAIKDYLLLNQKPYISDSAFIAKSAVIEGNVVVENGAKILENAVIKGPSYIGKNALVGNSAIVRGGTIVEENSVIGAGLEVKNVILFNDSTTHSGVLEDTIIGAGCKIAAGIITANVRLDRGIISTVVKEQKMQTGRVYMGIIVGNGTQLGIRVSTMPGIIIGQNVIIGPDTVVMRNITSNTKFYTLFKEVREESINYEK